LHRVSVLNIFFAILGATHLLAFDGQTRSARDDDELKAWQQNMYWHHRYSAEEMQQVTGLAASEVCVNLQQFGISTANRPDRPANKVFVLPCPGGRHPRIGFPEGAIEPQRETELSVFCPRDDRSDGIMDVPEAIWSNLELTCLAHPHIDTIWTKQGIDLCRQEWTVLPNGHFVPERTLKNGTPSGTKVMPLKDHVRMQMWLTNGTGEPLSDLRVQNCDMLKATRGFEQQNHCNKMFVNGYSAVRSSDAARWMISGWDPGHRPWAMHTVCARSPTQSSPTVRQAKPGGCVGDSRFKKEVTLIRNWLVLRPRAGAHIRGFSVLTPKQLLMIPGTNKEVT